MADEVEVTVTDNDSEEEPNPAPPVVVSAPVVVTDTPDDEEETLSLVAIAASVGSHEARIAALEAHRVEQDREIEEAALSAEVALDIATEPEPEPIEEDKPPVKPHWLHQSFSSLFGGND